MEITNTDGCVELIAAVINPKTHKQPGGRKPAKDQAATTLGEEWLSLAAGILDIDLDVVKKGYREAEL